MVLAKGADQALLARDFLTKVSSSSGGRSMSVHFSSKDHRIFPGVAPTGAQCPVSSGIAWGQKLLGNKGVTLCSIGEGAVRAGAFYEAVCAKGVPAPDAATYTLNQISALLNAKGIKHKIVYTWNSPFLGA